VLGRELLGGRLAVNLEFFGHTKHSDGYHRVLQHFLVVFFCSKIIVLTWCVGKPPNLFKKILHPERDEGVINKKTKRRRGG
jgi:hypothetical protein